MSVTTNPGTTCSGPSTSARTLVAAHDESVPPVRFVSSGPQPNTHGAPLDCAIVRAGNRRSGTPDVRSSFSLSFLSPDTKRDEYRDAHGPEALARCCDRTPLPVLGIPSPYPPPPRSRVRSATSRLAGVVPMPPYMVERFVETVDRRCPRIHPGRELRVRELGDVLLQAGVLLEAFGKFTPDLATAIRHAVEGSRARGSFYVMATIAFRRIRTCFAGCRTSRSTRVIETLDATIAWPCVRGAFFRLSDIGLLGRAPPKSCCPTRSSIADRDGYLFLLAQ